MKTASQNPITNNHFLTMSDKHSSEFKSKVAQEAASESQKVIQNIAAKYDISEDEVILWASKYADQGVELAAAEYDEGSVEDVDISTEDDELVSGISQGVMSDTLNYGKLIFWSTVGTSLVIIFVIAMVFFSQFSLFEAQREASLRVTYSDFSDLRAEQEQELNSFGVVDLEEGIYRIPIDSAISKIAID